MSPSKLSITKLDCLAAMTSSPTSVPPLPAPTSPPSPTTPLLL
eukprot:CAMPEP_0171958784 /NCGR_PEP_ID=MMETSP0993-20121228/142507_1 /TAXON_ID=483369 /ORGANISM="non described non described, Strain CCMP2098" /LENGTH=42 /DNA_ID= /DNA_START= /DNA_END= /DNA_ORIENTATION=